MIETVLVSFAFVADVGFELGGASGVRFLVLQIHYNYATTGLHALQSYRKRERERERERKRRAAVASATRPSVVRQYPGL